MGNLDIQGARLRSARSRKRIARADYEKFLRKCCKKQTKLYKEREYLPLVPLEKPYQRGYMRYFVLREDVKQGKDADFFDALLQKINTYQYSENKKFQKKRKRRGRRIYIPRKQELQCFSEREWAQAIEKGKLSEKERVYFRKTERFNAKRELFETFYEFAETWRFELRVKPNMITHYRPISIAIERELAQLNKIIDNYKNWGIIRRKTYCYTYAWKRYQKGFITKEKYKRTPLKEVSWLKSYASALEIAEKSLDNNY